MAGATPDKRIYLVVIDDSPESRVALQFAARRAAKTEGGVEVLAIVEPQDFVQWGGVQAAIEEEQRLRIEASVAAAVGEIMDAAGIQPHIIIRSGEPVQVVRTSRRLVFRLLAWNPWQAVFLRGVDHLRAPLRS